MEYQTLILDLMERMVKAEKRIKELEEDNKEIKQLVSKEKYSIEVEDGDVKMTRNFARQYVMSRVQSVHKGLIAAKGSRSTPGDIVISNNQNKKLHVKFYYSKSHLEHPSGWHTLEKSDAQNSNIDLYVFTVGWEGEYHSFLFTKDEMKLFLQNKHVNDAGKYYFYFQLLDSHKKIIEDRDGEKNAAPYYENWDVISQMIDKKITYLK